MAAMTRFVSQTLTRKPLLQPHPTIASIYQRHRSGKAHQTQLIELDLDSSQNDAAEAAAPGIRKLEEVLQSIIARRAAPDWLPFLPGYSYYVPPPPPTHDLIQVLGKFSNSNSHYHNPPFSTDRTWPSSTFFIEGTAPTHPLPMGSVAEVKLYEWDEAAQESSNEEE